MAKREDDLIIKFYKAIIAEDLPSIDQYIHEGLMIDQSYTYRYCHDRFYRNNPEDYYHFTPLICAVRTANIEVVEHLLKLGASVLIKCRKGKTPLYTATEMGNLEMVKILLENGAKPTMQTALLVAIEKKKLDIVRCLVENGAYINWKYRNGCTPLSKAITTKCEEIIKFLIDNGANVDEPINPGITDYTPLDLAIEYHMLDIVKYMLQKGANINVIDKPIIKVLLMEAIEKKNVDFVQYMVERGVCVNWKDEDGHTPLSKSITIKCGGISKILVDSGASLEELIDGSTPLILAVEKQMLNVLKYFIHKGANINQIDAKGRTALSVAASNKFLPFVTCLIESGADIHLAQKAVDEYAEEDEDFDIYLKLFKMEQLKLKNSDAKEDSVTLLEKQSGFGQEASPK